MALFSRGNKKVGRKAKRARSLEPVMQSQPVQQGPRLGDLTVGDYANGMPNIQLAEMFKSFGRQLKWLAPLLILGIIAAWHFTKDFKRTYTGEASLLVQLGDEYVYQPVNGQGGQSGLTLTADTIALNEVAIIKNPEIIKQVFGEMTSGVYASRFDPEGAKKLRAAGNNKRDVQEAQAEMLQSVDEAFYVAPRPKSSIIDLSYKHEDPEIAIETLSRLIAAYEDYRREIFVEGSVDIISERRRETEKQLASNERAISRFLSKSGVSDFGSEQDGVRERTEELRAALNLQRAEIAETESALATVESQLRGLSPQIDLYVDDRASQRVAQAELELKQLLAKYLPSSNPVRQKQTELAELKSLQSVNGGRAAGGRRVGPNPVYQELLTRRNILQSTADSYREKEFTLQRQLDSADNKVRKLTRLSPQYQGLLREQATLDDRLTTYNAKEQEALINQQLAAANSENVKVLSRPEFARKGRNMRLVMFALATVGWGFTLFMIALLRVFLDPRLYATPGPRHQAVQPEPRYDPIPEAVGGAMPTAAYAAPAAAEYVAQAYEPTAPAVYEPVSAYDVPTQEPYYAQGGGYAEPAPQLSPYEARFQNRGQHPMPAANPYAQADGNAALDVQANPYGTEPPAPDAPFVAPYPPTNQG